MWEGNMVQTCLPCPLRQKSGKNLKPKKYDLYLEQIRRVPEEKS